MMTSDMNENKPVSKVLVLDDSPVHANAIKRFCDEHNLVGLKVRKNRLLSVLRSNIDLGAILFSESYGGSLEESAEIAIKINTVRPELPIIIRRDSSATLDGLPDGLRRVVCAAYLASDMAPLRKVIDEYIYLQPGLSERARARHPGDHGVNTEQPLQERQHYLGHALHRPGPYHFRRSVQPDSAREYVVPRLHDDAGRRNAPHRSD